MTNSKQQASPAALSVPVACFWRWRTRYPHPNTTAWSGWQLADASYGRYKAALVDGAEYEIRWLYEGGVMSASPEDGT